MPLTEEMEWVKTSGGKVSKRGSAFAWPDMSLRRATVAVADPCADAVPSARASRRRSRQAGKQSRACDNLPFAQVMYPLPGMLTRSPGSQGFEENGEYLQHALVLHQGELQVPGKAGAHLGGAHYSFGGAELAEHDDYQILCWR